jgi:hypothetical protein
MRHQLRIVVAQGLFLTGKISNIQERWAKRQFVDDIFAKNHTELEYGIHFS